MSIASIRELPDGYTDEHDSTVWNIGYVFMWSDVYDAWLDCGVQLAVKPDMTVREAFEDYMDEPMWPGYSIFFNSIKRYGI